jgi:hypothetical protein
MDGHHPTDMNAQESLLKELIYKAKEQKRNVRYRLFDLKGDYVRPPSRGTLLPNGLKCLRWHFYTMSKQKLKKIQDQVTWVASQKQ